MYVYTYCNNVPHRLPKGGVLPASIGYSLRFLTRNSAGHHVVESPSVLPIRGVTTHISKLKRRTSWTATLKKLPDVHAFATYVPRIRDIRVHFFLAFQMLATTSGQYFPVAMRMQPRYLNATTLANGWPYARNYVSMIARESSVASLRHVLSSPLDPTAVLRWRPFRADQSTRISHQGQRGWVRLPYYTMTTVSRTWQCTEFTLIYVQLAAHI